ncbi:MAG: hypothetical protein ACAI34_20230 [Verrucomicrobium sp.]
MNTAEKAEVAMAAQQEQERLLAAAYRKTFTSPEGQRVMEDLRKHFDPMAPRFPAAFTKGHPLAAFFGGIHFDGSAVVMAHILKRMEAIEGAAEVKVVKGS